MIGGGPEQEEVPALTSEIVADDELLEAWLDEAIRLDSTAQARAGEIDVWRGWLRDGCEPDLWKLVLEIESRSNQRWTDLGVTLVRLGFEAGRGHPRGSVEVEGSP
jgi:hypothetical protein